MARINNSNDTRISIEYAIHMFNRFGAHIPRFLQLKDEEKVIYYYKGLEPVFFDSFPLPTTTPPQPKNRLVGANKSPSTETKVCSGGKVRSEGARSLHTAISMIYWPMGSFLRAADIPFCLRASVTDHQTDKSEGFAFLLLYRRHRYAADGEREGGRGRSKTVSKAIEQGPDFNLHNMMIFILSCRGLLFTVHQANSTDHLKAMTSNQEGSHDQWAFYPV